MCEIGHMLWSAGYTPGNSGNICVRVGEDEFLCTPTRVCKGMLTPDMILKVNSNLDVLEGFAPYKTTSEIRVHIAALKTRADKGALASIHAHAPYAQMCALLDIPIIKEETDVFKDVPRAPHATPGTPELAESVVAGFQEAPGVLMVGHGPVAVGKNLDDAFLMMEAIESTAKASYLCHQYSVLQEVRDLLAELKKEGKA